jgi:DNA-directed RNA polymerase specialized sigma24 family protein
LGAPDSPEEAARAAVEEQRRVTSAEASLRELHRERDPAVLAAVRAGVSYYDLAQALGVSAQTVANIARRLEREGEPRPSRPWLFQEGEGRLL